MEGSPPAERLVELEGSAGIGLSRDELEAADSAMRKLCSGEFKPGLEFDSFECSPGELYGIILGMFCSLGIATRLAQIERLLGFLVDMAADYRNNAYHSWFHAVDVTYMVYHSLTEAGVLPYLSRAESCALLLSAVAHDVLHPGKNNLFQINSNAEVAKIYNGVAVLENQSADHCFALMRKWDLLSVLTLDEVAEDSASGQPHEASDSKSEIDVSDAESDGGLWIGGTVTASGVAPVMPPPPRSLTPSNSTNLPGFSERIKRSTSDSPRPGESPRPGSRRASLASLGSGSMRGGARKSSFRTVRDRQAELAQMVEDLMLSAILYTDMKSHFQLQDRLEKIIEQAEAEEASAELEEEEVSPFVAAALRRRSSIPTGVSASASGGSLPPSQGSQVSLPTTSAASDPPTPAPDEDPLFPDDTTSQHSSFSSGVRRKSILVVHADDPNPSRDSDPELPMIPHSLRRRSILVQHADDNDPHGDDDFGVPLESVPSVPSVASASGSGSGRRKSVSELSATSSSPQHPDDDTQLNNISGIDQPYEPLEVPPQIQGGPRRPSVQFSDIDEIVRVNKEQPAMAVAVVETKARRRKSMEFEQRKLLLNAILHAADISNAARPWNLCKKWSDLVVQEFFDQGDAEKQLGLQVSPNMDRQTSDQYGISLGFIDFLCKPFFEVLADLLPGMAPLVDNLVANRETWARLQREEKERKEKEEGGQQAEQVEATSATTAVDGSAPPEEPGHEDEEAVGSVSSFSSIPMLSRSSTTGEEELLVSPTEPDPVAAISKEEKHHVPGSPVSKSRASMDSPRMSARSSMDAGTGEPFGGSGRRLSAAAGTIDLPDPTWFATHNKRPPSTHGRGLAALHSFSAFMSWKRLHSGASTPNLVGLAQQAEDQGFRSSPVSTRRLTGDATPADLIQADDEDVLQAIGWDDFLATEDQRDSLSPGYNTSSGRRRSGPSLSSLAMTLRNPKTGAPEEKPGQQGGLSLVNRRLTGTVRSASVDVYRPTPTRPGEEEGRKAVPAQGKAAAVEESGQGQPSL